MFDWIMNYGKKEIVNTRGKYAVRRWKMLSGWEYLDVKSGYWWSGLESSTIPYCLVDTIEEARVLVKEELIEIMENV